jgi:hypothetical protein
LDFIGDTDDSVLTVEWAENRVVKVMYHGVGGTGRVLWSELPVNDEQEVKTFPLHVIKEPENTFFMVEEMASGKTGEGQRFTVDMNISRGAIHLKVEGKSEVYYTVALNDLVATILTARREMTK